MSEKLVCQMVINAMEENEIRVKETRLLVGAEKGL